MQLELTFGPVRAGLLNRYEEPLRVGPRLVPLRLVRHRRARRYVLRLGADGVARVTIPRGGSAIEARRFAQKNESWLEQELVRHAHCLTRPTEWGLGTDILFRGERMRLEPGEADGVVKFGTESILVRGRGVRAAIQEHLWRLARRELPGRVAELAGLHNPPVRRVVVRNQRSRWGSCSRQGTISLNWRLVQAPEFVRDYIILHELAHLRHLNHSHRFWREVERLCPGYREAEKWLKDHGDLLR